MIELHVISSSIHHYCTHAFQGSNRGHLTSIGNSASQLKLNVHQIQTPQLKDKAYKMAGGRGVYLEAKAYV